MDQNNQKNILIGGVIQLVVGYGIGRLYIKNYFLGFIQLVLAVIGLSLTLITFIQGIIDYNSLQDEIFNDPLYAIIFPIFFTIGVLTRVWTTFDGVYIIYKNSKQKKIENME